MYPQYAKHLSNMGTRVAINEIRGNRFYNRITHNSKNQIDTFKDSIIHCTLYKTIYDTCIITALDNMVSPYFST